MIRFQPVITSALLALGGCAASPSALPGGAILHGHNNARHAGSASEANGALNDKPLTVDVAVCHALANDPELRAARHRVSAAYWEKVQVSLPANPRLSALADPTEWVVKLSGHITNLLDVGGRRRALVDAGESREELATLDVLRRQIELTRLVRSDFADAWVRGRTTHITQQHVELMREITETASRQRALGELAELEVLELEQQLEQAQLAMNEQSLLRRRAEARLNRWLGRPLDADVQLAMPEEESDWIARNALKETGTETGQNVGSAEIDLGMLRRPELAVLAARAREARAMMKVARVQWLEGIEGGLYLKREGDSTVEGGEIAIVLPVFDRGQAQRGVHSGTLAALEEQLLATQATLLLEVHEAVMRLRHARQQVRVGFSAIHELAVARHGLLVQAEGRGEASQLDVRLARMAVLDAEMEVAQGRLALWRAWADLAAAMGHKGCGPDSSECTHVTRAGSAQPANYTAHYGSD